VRSSRLTHVCGSLSVCVGRYSLQAPIPIRTHKRRGQRKATYPNRSISNANTFNAFDSQIRVYDTIGSILRCGSSSSCPMENRSTIRPNIGLDFLVCFPAPSRIVRPNNDIVPSLGRDEFLDGFYRVDEGEKVEFCSHVVRVDNRVSKGIGRRKLDRSAYKVCSVEHFKGKENKKKRTRRRRNQYRRDTEEIAFSWRSNPRYYPQWLSTYVSDLELSHVAIELTEKRNSK